jgi:hypothetical protein
MNPTLTARFAGVADKLMAKFGREMTRTAANGEETLVMGVVNTQAVAVGEFGERMDAQTTLQIAAATGAVVGDTYTYAGTSTEDDPYPDDVVWAAAQLISDDGFVRVFAVRRS